MQIVLSLLRCACKDKLINFQCRDPNLGLDVHVCDKVTLTAPIAVKCANSYKIVSMNVDCVCIRFNWKWSSKYAHSRC